MGIASRIAAVTENLGGDYPTGGIQYNLNALEEAAQGGGGGGGYRYESDEFNVQQTNKDILIPFNESHANAPFFVCVAIYAGDTSFSQMPFSYLALTAVDFRSVLDTGFKDNQAKIVDGIAATAKKSDSTSISNSIELLHSNDSASGTVMLSKYMTNEGIILPAFTSQSAVTVRWMAIWLDNGSDDSGDEGNPK